MKNYKVLKTSSAGEFVARFFLYIFLILVAIICIAPFYIMIINATRSNQEINMGISLIPGKAIVENYKTMINGFNIWRGFLNSLIVAVPSTILSAYIGALTAYAFSKFRFIGNRLLFWIVLGTIMIPNQLGIVGYFQLSVKLHLVDSLLVLILPALANAYSVFFIRMYIDANVDSAFIEAARIDGCNEFYIFNKIIIPIIMPAIATVSILTFISTWNNYLTPLVLLFDKNKYTLPILVTLVKGRFSQNLGAQYLAVAISVVPILIVFVLFSRYIIGGIAAGALKE